MEQKKSGEEGARKGYMLKGFRLGKEREGKLNLKVR